MGEWSGTRYCVCIRCAKEFAATNSNAKMCGPCKKELGISRYTNYPEQPCLACTSMFQPVNNRQKFCKTCVPDKKWYAVYRRYGLTKPDYETLAAKQDNACPLCLQLLVDVTKVAIDHCHDSGEVRGILCNRCNSVLSEFEKPEYVARVFKYLNMGRR